MNADVLMPPLVRVHWQQVQNVRLCDLVICNTSPPVSQKVQVVMMYVYFLTKQSKISRYLHGLMLDLLDYETLGLSIAKNAT